MRIFPHGNVVNFQGSVREMTASELERLLERVLDEGTILAGSLDLQQSELVVYGQAIGIQLDEEADRITLTTRTEDGEEHTNRSAFEDLLISHEMHFDIEEPEGETVRYTVYYMTFSGDSAAPSPEKTWFFADEQAVTRPLDCVVEFWRQAGESGRDADFTSNGCSVPASFKRDIQKDC
ncbi:hypothetical protein [Desmospora profundinema]|uniref:Uncharacterized protein n=1 Tax=Desmospora profundinema TaxID=1571184 RepID=A0ABU1IMR6_9BACL|nr:hypothetical protein [Desmospora profundinema]MDR6225254.1 hypothetical protein [Desmospora profundinema]